MAQGRAIRYYAEQKGGSSSLDVVEVTTMMGTFQMGYEQFNALFGLEIQKGGDIAFSVEKAYRLKSEECEVPL